MSYRYEYQCRELGSVPVAVSRTELFERLKRWRVNPGELVENLESILPHGEFYYLSPFESYRVTEVQSCDYCQQQIIGDVDTTAALPGSVYCCGSCLQEALTSTEAGDANEEYYGVDL